MCTCGCPVIFTKKMSYNYISGGSVATSELNYCSHCDCLNIYFLTF